MTLKKYNKSTF